MSVFDEIRCAAAAVSARARFVRIVDEPLRALALELAAAAGEPEVLDPAHHHLGSPETTLAYVICLDAVNFGSGYFPHLRKRPGCSGYFTIALGLKERFEGAGPLSASELASIDVAECAEIFGQGLYTPSAGAAGAATARKANVSPGPIAQAAEPVAPSIELMAPSTQLMALFSHAWNDLGRLLEADYGGRFDALVEDAGGRAERMVGLLGKLPAYRDVARHGALRVPFYKRAQLTCADLHAALDGRGPGRFEDLDELTIFADNLVPHVLRRRGVLVYDEGLLARIAREELIEAGSAEEVEIRAAAVHAVERMTEVLAEAGTPLPARRLDFRLWSLGQSPEIKAEPRHRTRTTYY